MDSFIADFIKVSGKHYDPDKPYSRECERREKRYPLQGLFLPYQGANRSLTVASLAPDDDQCIDEPVYCGYGTGKLVKTKQAI